MSPLVSVADLAAGLAAGAPVRLLDVRWRLNRPEGRPEYLAGHLPGAGYVDLERELTQPGRTEEGSHPLPALADLAAAVRRWGVRAEERVVVYDDNDSVAAARAWWLLRGHGIEARVLDGGLRAWVAAGLRLERSDRRAKPGDVELAAPDLDVAGIEEAATAPGRGILIDVRAPQHYRGQVGGADPIAGHIPGAVNIPTVTHIAPDGRLLPPERIAETLAAHGITADTAVVLTCSSGIPSMHSALAFATVGLRPRVHVGSWSQWSRSPGRPVALGAAPAEVIVSA